LTAPEPVVNQSTVQQQADNHADKIGRPRAAFRQFAAPRSAKLLAYEVSAAAMTTKAGSTRQCSEWDRATLGWQETALISILARGQPVLMMGCLLS